MTPEERAAFRAAMHRTPEARRRPLSAVVPWVAGAFALAAAFAYGAGHAYHAGYSDATLEQRGRAAMFEECYRAKVRGYDSPYCDPAEDLR